MACETRHLCRKLLQTRTLACHFPVNNSVRFSLESHSHSVRTRRVLTTRVLIAGLLTGGVAFLPCHRRVYIATVVFWAGRGEVSSPLENNYRPRPGISGPGAFIHREPTDVRSRKGRLRWGGFGRRGRWLSQNFTAEPQIHGATMNQQVCFVHRRLAATLEDHDNAAQRRRSDRGRAARDRVPSPISRSSPDRNSPPRSRRYAANRVQARTRA